VRVTKQYIEKLIKEELNKTLRENDQANPGRVFRSPTLFDGFRNTSQINDPNIKPNGLWYSCGSEWDDWCESEMPDWIDRAPHVYNLQINPSNMLIIRTGEELEAFNEEFGSGDIPLIDWKKVAEQYDGIEICPYQWDYRLANNFLWYYGWDVASGCIWNEGGFKSVEKIKDLCRSL